MIEFTWITKRFGTVGRCSAAPTCRSTAVACGARRSERRRQDDAHQDPARSRASHVWRHSRQRRADPSDDVVPRRIGYMPQIARFPENLTASELFDMVRDLRGPAAPIDDETDSALRTARPARQTASRAVGRNAPEGQRVRWRSSSVLPSSCSTSRPPGSTRSRAPSLKDKILARQSRRCDGARHVAHHERARGPVRRRGVSARRRGSLRRSGRAADRGRRGSRISSARSHRS